MAAMDLTIMAAIQSIQLVIIAWFAYSLRRQAQKDRQEDKKNG